MCYVAEENSGASRGEWALRRVVSDPHALRGSHDAMASESISSDRIRARQSRGSLQRPRLGPSCVARPRLVHRLSGATTLPVTTLIAPAGYGKTTAVLEWLSSLTDRHI